MSTPSEVAAKLSEICAIARFDAPSIAIREIISVLDHDLDDADGGDVRLWSLMEADDPTYLQLRNTYLDALVSEDPLAVTGDCSSAAGLLNARMRVAASSRQGRAIGFPQSLAFLRWETLTEACQVMLRNIIGEAAQSEHVKIRRGQPQRIAEDTIVSGLAEVFARHTSFVGCHYDLPHAENSAFIHFASNVMCVFPSSSVLSEEALSKRWRRIKRHRNNGA